MPKNSNLSSMRSCAVRLFCSNNTDNGVISFTDEQVLDLVDEWSCVKNYAYIKHIETEKSHYHFYIEFKNPVPFTNIKNHFNSVSDISKVRSKKKCIQYLIHFNDSDKFQYKVDDIISNFDLSSFFDSRCNIDLIIEDINQGKITQYNYTNYVSISTYSKFKSLINNAFDYYIDSLKHDLNRVINVMFFTGASGSGKTLYAKNWAFDKGLSYCVSSSSNDPLQDYGGQDVLILDDLRDNSFNFQDLLKVLDNHTNTSIKSRYRNKFFLGTTIIITSCLPLSSWYSDIYFEDKLQLYRRIGYMFDFQDDVVSTYIFNSYTESYDFLVSFENPKLSIIKKLTNKSASNDSIYKDILSSEKVIDSDLPF